MHLLDTNICVYVIRDRPPQVRTRLNELGEEGVAISVITAMELEVGALRSGGTEYSRRVGRYLQEAEILALDDSARDAYARLRFDLERRGAAIGPLDMLIAAHALALDATLVTHNEREFRRVKGLKVADWTR